MVSEDQTVGWLIFLVCAIVGFAYVIGFFVLSKAIQFWLIAIPVIIAFVLVLSVGAWIGWTMATTPAPKPIEEIEAGEIKQGEDE